MPPALTTAAHLLRSALSKAASCSLLMPEARCGGRVRVRSERYNGVFRTRKVTHDLDTMGGPWYSDFESINDPGVAVA